MTFHERATLDPFEKWQRFRVFPFLFIIHLLLIAATSLQAMSIVGAKDNYSRVQEQVFSSIFLDNEDGTNTAPFFSLSDFQEHLEDLFVEAKDFSSTLLQFSDSSGLRLLLEAHYLAQSPANAGLMRFELDPAQGTITRPFNLSDPLSLKAFLQVVQALRITISGIRTSDRADFTASCRAWQIGIDYSLQTYANVEASLSASSQPCSTHGPATRNLSFDFVVLLLSGAGVLVLVLDGYDFLVEQKAYDLRVLQVGETREQLKVQYFDLWFYMSLAGNAVQFMGASVSVLVEFGMLRLENSSQETLVGFGTMLAWTSIMNYLRYTNNLDILSSTLYHSWQNIFTFLVGVLPFFMGFVFLGQCIFWKYTKFEDTSATVVTLFALSNGDIVNDTFLQTWAEGFFGQVYLIVFLILFYTAVQNVFITIIMEGYETSIKEKEYKKAFEEKEDQERSHFEQQMLKSHRESSVSNPIELYIWRIEQILAQIKKNFKDQKEAALPQQKEQALLKEYRELLQNLNRNLKFQIATLKDIND